LKEDSGRERRREEEIPARAQETTKRRGKDFSRKYR
jgi:hypothetical protein